LTIHYLKGAGARKGDNEVRRISDDARKKITYILLIFLLTSFLFAFTVVLREPYFGALSQRNHQWLTADTLKFSRNWYREGPVKLRFGMFLNPDSIEFPTLSMRELYISYPPGTVVPIYLLSVITRREPSLALIHSYNLFNHFMVAFFLALTIFFFLLQMGFRYLTSFLAATAPLFMVLFMPAPLYWFQNVFFADQAVILPVVLFIFLEVLRKSVKSKGGLSAVACLQAMVFFYGLLVDWFFIFMALVVFFNRLIRGDLGRGFLPRLKKTLLYWLPAAAVGALFAAQLTILGGWDKVLEKFLYRSGLGEGGGSCTASFFEAFWKGHVAEGYGAVAIYLLWGSLIILALSLAYAGCRRWRREEVATEAKDTMSLICALLIPCFAQVYVFRNHSALHSFSTAKFVVPLALVPLILVPLLIYFLFRNHITRISQRSKELTSFFAAHWKSASVLIALVPLTITLVYLGFQSSRFLILFPFNNDYGVEEFVGQNTAYEEVVFSPNYEIRELPPQQLAVSMKRVYHVSSLAEMYEKVRGIEGDYVVDVLILEEGREYQVEGLEELLGGADEEVMTGTLRLYKLRKETFLGLFREQEAT